MAVTPEGGVLAKQPASASPASTAPKVRVWMVFMAGLSSEKVMTTA